MALAPLDLQVLYSQLETVSKTVAHQQQGQQLANAIQRETHAQQLAEKNSTVQQLKSGEDSVHKIKDRAAGGGSSQNGSGRRQSETETEEKEASAPVAFQDPNLGKFIDISG